MRIVQTPYLTGVYAQFMRERGGKDMSASCLYLIRLLSQLELNAEKYR